MLALLDQTSEPVTANDSEAAIARQATERLRDVAASGNDIVVHVDVAPEIAVPLPARAVRVMLEILEAMADRTPISVIPFDAELTTKQAADFLNVSRPYLVGLIDKGKLAYRKVGSHRRVKFADLVEYERMAKEDQKAAIAEMIAHAEELGIE